MKYTFAFKEVNTQTLVYIHTDSSVSVRYFVKNAKNLLSEEYRTPLSCYSIDLIEAGHYNNSNGWAPELADKLEVMYNENDTIEKIYSKTWKNTSFYVRVKLN